ncbi:glucose-methanol-choline oxidoreductase-like protein [Aspergillus aurantiobrunneus]
MTISADIIIIGGGTAGLVLAARISENPAVQVLVLEAGQDQTSNSRVLTPALWPALVASDSDWKFMTEPQAALDGKQIPQPQGRMLGGTSAVNGMAFIANSKANINAWEALGNPEWTWETVSAYDRKSFMLTMPSDEKQRELGLEYVDEKGLGYPMRTDPFSGHALGGYTNAATIDPRTKSRSYSANAYLLPARERPNLHVVTGAQVNKILLDRLFDGEVATTGVEYTRDGQVSTATARREVILTAGVYNSPKLLELSGIGSSSIFSQLNILVLVDNPNVGENLQDHPMAGLSYEVQDFINTKDDLMRRVPEVVGAAMEDYKSKQSGPFTVGGNYSSALLPLPELSHPETGTEDLTSILAATSESQDAHPLATALTTNLQCLLQDPSEATAGYFTYPAQSDFRGSGSAVQSITSKFPENYITICTLLLHPLSRGTSHITSANPSDPPQINPRYLSHPADLELFARHTRFIDAIATSHPLSSMLKPNGKRTPGTPPDLHAVPLDEVKGYVRGACKCTFHATSTCAMMPREKGGVVDARLRVWGVKGLRVVDASVVPIAPRGNSQSAVYAIAERAADLIKEDLGLKVV